MVRNYKRKTLTAYSEQQVTAVTACPQLIEHKKIEFLTKIMNFEELQKNT